MIPNANIIAWRAKAPWISDGQVEQDLILSRIIVEIFSDPLLSALLAFRGGTALQKIFFNPPMRYSEDIDLVQTTSGKIKPILQALHDKLDPWLGKPKTEINFGRAKMFYRFETEIPPIRIMRVKIEINTREHFTILGLQKELYKIENDWFSGTAEVITYCIEELLGTKLRALYQRKKGRDLFDLASALKLLEIDPEKVIKCFQGYMQDSNAKVSRAEYESNLSKKLKDPYFLEDTTPLLSADAKFNILQDAKHVHSVFISRLQGEPWKAAKEILEIAI